jgi:hypothetical protein
MAWHIPPPSKGGNRLWLGIKPTPEDHALVKAWTIMGITRKEVKVRLSERYGLPRVISNFTLFYHFKDDLVAKASPSGKNKISRNAIKSIESEMQKMMATVKARQPKAPDGEESDPD